MKNSLHLITVLILAIVVSLGILTNFITVLNPSDTLTLGILKSDEHLIVALQSRINANKKNDQSFKIITYSNESALLDDAFSGALDAYVINPFSFIPNLRELPRAMAILGISSDYLLASKNKDINNGNTVGVFDNSLSDFILSEGSRFNGLLLDYVYCESPLERLELLNEGIIDYAIFEDSYINDALKSGFTPIQSLSDLGVNEKLLVMKKSLVEDGNGETLNTVELLTSYFDQSLLAPDEEMLNKVATWLYSNNKIKTRYYYTDLAHVEKSAHKN